MKHSPLLLVALLAAQSVSAQNKGQLNVRTDAEILKTVTLPAGYAATVFAKPPLGGYPTSVSAAVDGTVFVAIDENGSLGRDRNPGNGLEGPSDGRIPGKVVRMRDTDGDGRADEFKTFCTVESPRGVIWDGPSGTAPGQLIVMHPANLTVYTDTDGDGVSDKQEDILTGLGFDLSFRGADHTTNGCRLAIDGFIYIAVGDYGFVNAKAKDGTTLTNRGGGVVRIRPDGTGFEIVSRGQRNIYDVAVSPTLDIFTRDNTNDGGNWNVRLSFIPPGAHMGYPYLFKNFSEDMFDALADFGGGSPCGALWMDEPGLPKGLFTVEWGAGGIFYHDDLVPDGAGWKLANAAPADGTPVWKRAPSKQQKWIGLNRPTDMDVDASGAIFITSWEGATFNYNGPNAGYVLRVVKMDAPNVEVPDLVKATVQDLTTLIGFPSATIRLAVQREILRRKDFLTSKVRSPKVPTDGKFLPAYEFAIACMTGNAMRAANEFQVAKYGPDFATSVEGTPDSAVAWMHVLGDNADQLKNFKAEVITPLLSSKHPRVRAAAITALRRLGKTDAAPAILPLVADSDLVISHLAFRALRELKAVEPCLAALDSSDDTVKPGALRALYGIYDPAVVDGLIARLPNAKGELRRGLLNALCRLANQDAPYENPKDWWSTRPDTTGPIYQPIPWSETDKISAALKAAIEASSEEDAKWLVQRMYACKVAYPGLVELMLAQAGTDTPAKLTAIEGLIRSDNSMPPEAVRALQSVTTDEKQPPELRAQGLRLFQKCSENGAVFPGAVAAFAPLAGHEISDARLTAVFEDFTRDGENGKWIGEYTKLLAGNDPAKRQLAAVVLVNLSTGKVGKEQDREAAKMAVEKGFAKPESAAALLTAIARTGAKSLAEQVKANLNNPTNAVAEAALFAYQKLGLKDTSVPTRTIAEMKYEEVFAAVQQGGDAQEGQQLFLRAACIACHTIDADEPPKGPVLGAVAKIYDRAALTESILKPNARLAQGFETAFFKTKKGDVEGFVIREGGDSVDVRNVAGQTVTIEKGDVTERGVREKSMMPEGLLNTFTPAELANLLAWLESLKK